MKFYTVSLILIFSTLNFAQNYVSMPAKDLNCIIKYEVSNENSDFNSDAISDSVIMNINGKEVYGFKSNNFDFFQQVLKPVIIDHIDVLKKLSKSEIINQLTIFVYQIYQDYFGKSFYRWGGDIFDLDDPQFESIRYKQKFGLDCSGFTVVGYELAAYFNLIPFEGLLFSSQGFKIFCEKTGFEDTGGLIKKSNNYRLDTKELDQLGNEIIRIEKGNKLTEDQLLLLKAGDIIGREGHYGILVKSDDKLFYLESGGYVVPFSDYNAVEAKAAIDKFAESGYVSVRRCIAD